MFPSSPTLQLIYSPEKPRTPSTCEPFSPSYSNIDAHPSGDAISTTFDMFAPFVDFRPTCISSSSIRSSTKLSQPSVRLHGYHCYSTIASFSEPCTYRETGTNPLWQQSMIDELQALNNSHTWDLVDLPLGKSAVGCRFVYKIKTKAVGTMDHYKAQLRANSLIRNI